MARKHTYQIEVTLRPNYVNPLEITKLISWVAENIKQYSSDDVQRFEVKKVKNK